ncbi:MAG TPA: SpoIIE family protein phosphatase [Tepidisphaeraceae bacterium]|jgi:serine phosphatase RsbU (regulator of sigma subunit)|nr:SpoIIE family protein phosphatase [Tepidisphaeraceae bacterium]
MEHAARRFARNVLLAHVLLLTVVVVFVVLAVRVLQSSARAQAMDQARQTQELLAKQTALGVQNYYQSVRGVFDLLKPLQSEDMPEPLPGMQRLIDRTTTRPLDIRHAYTQAIWQSVEGRVSLLFLVDSKRGGVLNVFGDEGDTFEQQKARAHLIAKENLQWIDNVSTATISPFLRVGDEAGHLVAVPMGGPLNKANHRVLLAFVPMNRIEKTLLSEVNRENAMGAMLVDASGTIVSNFNPDAVGLNVLKDSKDPRTREMAEKQIAAGTQATQIFEYAENIGGVEFQPSMVTMQPITVLDQRWWLVISSRLSAIDRILGPFFKEVLLWAGFLIVAMTAILVSTAVQVIRGRVRMERMRHELLNQELLQAREIQLNWLPEANCGNRMLDIAAINTPASHVSGDFYNWFELPDGRIVIAIGDVTGHGMAAAFLMATTQMLIRTSMPRITDPGLCLEEVNRQLCIQVFNGQFVTMEILVLDLENCTVDIATAGHPPPLVGSGEAFSPLPIDPQLVLGVEPSIRFPTHRFTLPRNANLLLYTDGVIDAQSATGERFNEEGLAASLYGKFDNAQAMIDTVIEAIDDFRKGRDLNDDLTLVAIQLQPEPAEEEQLVESS